MAGAGTGWAAMLLLDGWLGELAARVESLSTIWWSAAGGIGGVGARACVVCLLEACCLSAPRAKDAANVFICDAFLTLDRAAALPARRSRDVGSSVPSGPDRKDEEDNGLTD